MIQSFNFHHSNHKINNRNDERWRKRKKKNSIFVKGARLLEQWTNCNSNARGRERERARTRSFAFSISFWNNITNVLITHIPPFIYAIFEHDKVINSTKQQPSAIAHIWKTDELKISRHKTQEIHPASY